MSTGSHNIRRQRPPRRRREFHRWRRHSSRRGRTERLDRRSGRHNTRPVLHRERDNRPNFADRTLRTVRRRSLRRTCPRDSRGRSPRGCPTRTPGNRRHSKNPDPRRRGSRPGCRCTDRTMLRSRLGARIVARPPGRSRLRMKKRSPDFLRFRSSCHRNRRCKTRERDRPGQGHRSCLDLRGRGKRQPRSCRSRRPEAGRCCRRRRSSW